ncbi:hypothetical protein [Streptomyces lavendulae]|uniref:hypothetical protein n=1 Tax=Streptomyces lavendulae TaxID=1914 RepID=UPI0024A437FB|nr:hypothetical protein [Streptomyces lavendulae]GLX23454.1 hypothetical protein Slala01_70980 [Streptomyces lavendulae subsp. lavendulae]GLX31250.1 hypothetical protein Slala02_70690 [Streptomyces lavendulae subsp. lavendulae]
MPDQQHPQPSARTPTHHHPHHPHHRGADWMFGGVYGTVLASALLAALDERGAHYTPLADAAWILVTAAAAALAHGYAHHMADHLAGAAAHRWRLLGRALWNEWPMIAATLPTLLLLLLAEIAHWEPYGVTAVGLGLNTALLFAWGAFVALRVGYRIASALLIGLADAAIGLAIIVANAFIK